MGGFTSPELRDEGQVNAGRCSGSPGLLGFVSLDLQRISLGRSVRLSLLLLLPCVTSSSEGSFLQDEGQTVAGETVE